MSEAAALPTLARSSGRRARAGAQAEAVAAWVLASAHDAPRVHDSFAVAADFRGSGANYRLTLPPGWRLLAVEGADRTDGAWVNRWSLYDLFLLLLTGVVAARIFGLGWGVATVAVIGLSWHEGGSVRATWLVFLVTTALTRAVTSGRIARALRGGRALVAAARPPSRL